MSNIISQQVSYKRGSTIHEFAVLYESTELGTVERKLVDGKVQWLVNDEEFTMADTRDDAVTKFVARNFELVIQ